jgi:hypothetical protein
MEQVYLLILFGFNQIVTIEPGYEPLLIENYEVCLERQEFFENYFADIMDGELYYTDCVIIQEDEVFEESLKLIIEEQQAELNLGFVQ